MDLADNYTKQMGGAKTAAIRIGNVTGVVAKLPENSADMNFGFGAGGDVMLFWEFQKKNGGPARQINLPKEAIEMAKKQEETHIRILIFPGIIGKNGSNDSLFSDEVLGIKMGRNISNLSQRIKIQYKDATLMQTEQKYTCVSWTIKNREDTNPNWTMDGCNTTLEDKGAKCECSHLTFFAILINKKIEEKRTTLTFRAPDRPLTSEEAANLMKNLSSIVDMMGNAQVATIEMGKISGVIQRLPQQNKTTINIGFDARGKVEEKDDVVTGSMQTIRLSKEASEMAVKKNGSYAGVLRFPDIEKLNKTSLFLNNVILGIDMGVNISNLSETIDIHFRDVNTAEANATCVSWDGTSKEGGKEKWITDGCLTKESNGSITCQCSHLTFFAILMTSGENISPSHLEALTQITKAGCGMSIFFLSVAIFMHFLIRKTKATQAVQILMNLFIALFFLNLCFLLNETIANLENFAACVVMAAFMHYSMLATFTWFFMQALHLYFNLHKIPTDVKYYICKICCTGWVLPAVMVLGLVASNKYDHVTISGNNDTSVNMCWIPDSTIHLGVNIGYYSIVFIFTLTIFIVTIVHIKHYASKEKKTQESSKTRIFSLLGLFCLLGITWGFAFFSYGPMLLPSYYIFTILNSFQGFFLFVYYYFSSKILPEDQKQSQSSSQSSQTVYTSPYG
ncbi:PREDICTED: adhesion G-protein coupled receptor G2-like [Cyprinodon variegatus]|uniref:adhesion G-protein coupled receptor G2-like n=1 Tax=Cyprinodon variegatus TaxID=28743 RepID=UPI000742BBD7|nr:PREDICTED: adhesion G-protein coupled receptor G2-like [Cyprinodon variegatus]